MRRWAFLAGIVSLSIAGLFTQSVHALSLEIRPLEYKLTLAKGETKKGYIDVTNPTAETVHIRTEVQAFRQVDDRGSLQFYDNERLAAGIIPDVNDFDLRAGETLRMYFLVNGDKLSAGDNFGALFFRTIPKEGGGVNSSLRLGTLFSIQNATTTDHQAKVTSVDVPFFQLGQSIQGSYSITNTANPNSTNGFYPQVKLTVAPFIQTKVQTSSLVFAGHTRTNNFAIETLRFGIYTLTVDYNGVQQTRLMFVATRWQLVIATLFVVAFGLGGYLLWHRRHTVMPKLRKAHKKAKKTE